MTRRVIGPVAVAVDTNTKFRQGFSKIVAVARGDRVRMRPELEFMTGRRFYDNYFVKVFQMVPNGFTVRCRNKLQAFLKNCLKGISIHRVEIATGQYVVIRLHNFNGWNRTKLSKSGLGI